MSENKEERIAQSDIMDEGNKLVEKLTIVRDEYIKAMRNQEFSIRRDLIAAELRDMLVDHRDYESLTEAILKYIEKLLDPRMKIKMEKVEEEG